MKRLLARDLLLAGLIAFSTAGVTFARGGPYMKDYYTQECPDGCSNCAYTRPSVPTVVGAWGQPVPLAFPYTANPPSGPSGEAAARAMLAQSVPLELQMAAMAQMGPGGPAFRPGAENLAGMPGPMGGGMPMGPQGMPGPGGFGGNMPPLGAQGMPGPYGNMGNPGMGLPPGPFSNLGTPPSGGSGYPGNLGGPQRPSGGNLQLTGGGGSGGGTPYPVQRTEVRFGEPAGMKISWYTTKPDGKVGFGAQTLETPGRYNFLQAAIYRLKLSDIPGKPGMELYPTLEVVPCNNKTSTFLAHSAVPVNITDEDLDQVASGNMVTKVIYLPDPQFQDLAATGLAEVVSSQLEPGVNPIQEAQRKGSILLVVRLGNILLELENTPAMDAPPPGGAAPLGAAPAGPVMSMQPGGNGMSRMVPYGMNPSAGMPNPNVRPALPVAIPQASQPGMSPPTQPTQPGARPGTPPAPFPGAGPTPGQVLPQNPGTPNPSTPPALPASTTGPVGLMPPLQGIRQVGFQRPQYLPDPTIVK